MALRRLSLIRGDSQTYTLTFKKADGTLYSLKNWAVFFTLKTNYSLPDAQASLQKIYTSSGIFDATCGSASTTGVAVVTLAPTDTVDLEPQEYDFDISVRTAANESYTVMKEKFDLEYDVTRTAGTAGTAA
jgi:hypothetical protein